MAHKRNKTFAKFYPHKTISTPTVCRWITEVLWLSGIDTATFTGHSTRSASSSKAKVPGVLRRGYCSNATTFETLHNKEVKPDENEFQSSILQGFEEGKFQQ